MIVFQTKPNILNSPSRDAELGRKELCYMQFFCNSLKHKELRIVYVQCLQWTEQLLIENSSRHCYLNEFIEKYVNMVSRSYCSKTSTIYCSCSRKTIALVIGSIYFKVKLNGFFFSLKWLFGRVKHQNIWHLYFAKKFNQITKSSTSNFPLKIRVIFESIIVDMNYS